MYHDEGDQGPMALDMWAPWPGTINKVMSHGPWARHSPWTHGPWASETMPGPWAQDDIHNSPILLCVYIYIYIYSACVRLTGDAATGDDVEMDARADADSDYPDWGEDDASWQSHQWDWG